MESAELTHIKENRKELFMEVDSMRKKLGFSVEEFCKLAEFPISLSTYVSWLYSGSTPNHNSALMLLQFLESDKPKQLENISIEKRRKKEQRNKLNKFPNIKLNSNIDTKEAKWIQTFFEEIIEFQQEYNFEKKELAKALGIAEYTLVKWIEQITTPSPGKIFDVRNNMTAYRKKTSNIN